MVAYPTIFTNTTLSKQIEDNQNTWAEKTERANNFWPVVFNAFNNETLDKKETFFCASKTPKEKNHLTIVYTNLDVFEFPSPSNMTCRLKIS